MNALLRELTVQVNKRRKDLRKSYFAQELYDAEKDSRKAWGVLQSP